MNLFLFFIISGTHPVDTTSWYYRGFNPSAEIKILRTPNSKVFRRQGARAIRRIFVRPVHWIDEDGSLKDIPENFPYHDIENYTALSSLDSVSIDGSACGDDMGILCLFDNCTGYCDVGCGYYIWINEGFLVNGFVKFWTGSIPDTTKIDTIWLNLYCVNPGTPFSCTATHNIVEIDTNQTFTDGCNLYNDAINGIQYISNYCPYTTGWKQWLLSKDTLDPAAQQMMRLLPKDWFAVGLSGWSSGWFSSSIGYQRGSAYIDIPLGIEEVVFVASLYKNYIKIKWTSVGRNINILKIFRKEENSDYILLSEINHPSQNFFIDRNVREGVTYYYKLNVMFADGEEKTFGPLKVYIPFKKLEIHFLPKISQKKVFINLSLFEKENVNIFLIDPAGRVHNKEFLNLNPGNYSIPFALPEPSGISLINVQAGKNEKIMKLIKLP